MVLEQLQLAASTPERISTRQFIGSPAATGPITPSIPSIHAISSPAPCSNRLFAKPPRTRTSYSRCRGSNVGTTSTADSAAQLGAVSHRLAQITSGQRLSQPTPGRCAYAGPSPEAVKFLLDERDMHGFGVELESTSTQVRAANSVPRTRRTPSSSAEDITDCSACATSISYHHQAPSSSAAPLKIKRGCGQSATGVGNRAITEGLSTLEFSAPTSRLSSS